MNAGQAGYSAQNWSSMGWLRVDFNRNDAESSALICDWYQRAPTVTVGSQPQLAAASPW